MSNRFNCGYLLFTRNKLFFKLIFEKSYLPTYYLEISNQRRETSKFNTVQIKVKA